MLRVYFVSGRADVAGCVCTDAPALACGAFGGLSVAITQIKYAAAAPSIIQKTAMLEKKEDDGGEVRSRT